MLLGNEKQSYSSICLKRSLSHLSKCSKLGLYMSNESEDDIYAVAEGHRTH